MNTLVLLNAIMSVILNMSIYGRPERVDFDTLRQKLIRIERRVYSGIELDKLLPDTGNYLVKLVAKDGYYVYIPPKLLGTGTIFIADSLYHNPLDSTLAPFFIVLLDDAAKHRFLAVKMIDSIVVEPIEGFHCPKILKVSKVEDWLNALKKFAEDEVVIFSTIDSLQWVFPAGEMKEWTIVPDSGMTGKFIRLTAKNKFEAFNINDPIWMLHDTVAMLLCPSAELVVGDSIELKELADDIILLGPNLKCGREVKDALEDVYLRYDEKGCHFVKVGGKKPFDVIHVPSQN
ncbi:MAG: hypothetical protein DRQ10_03955 [Candidatus Hydrothermota bacterium]|nr:MAG: hypothetical protein DRQ10_03955 [Candidatus Hydrothermae bacterium]